MDMNDMGLADEELTLEQAVRNQIAEAQKIASGSGSEIDIAEAKIELEVSLHAENSRRGNANYGIGS
jgi:hypothetical protein